MPKILYQPLPKNSFKILNVFHTERVNYISRGYLPLSIHFSVYDTDKLQLEALF